MVKMCVTQYVYDKWNNSSMKLDQISYQHILIHFYNAAPPYIFQNKSSIILRFKYLSYLEKKFAIEDLNIKFYNNFSDTYY